MVKQKNNNSIGDRAKIFKDQPAMSRAEEECRREATLYAEELDREETRKLGSLQGISKLDANKLKNRKSAKVSRALKTRYLELLRARAQEMTDRIASLRNELGSDRNKYR
ncbi:hypothetical protein NDN08_006090 [Rhodosorus marinus]|uniref:BZIP domain-containing protein n=1 Tax=Rhodosorus marinus TaxID=101924 RepID=A0AAV8UJS5_9RHOD|nr:hypothetical protein NDN08_006090 [Rhodosorus marinus]